MLKSVKNATSEYNRHTAAINELHNSYVYIMQYNLFNTVNVYLIQNSQAVKKVCGPQKGYGEKRCEIQGGGQEMAVMVG